MLTLLSFSNVFSQDMWKFKGGINFSWFEDANHSSSGVGYIVEVQRSINLSGYYDLLIGFNLQSRSGVLYDRTISYVLPDLSREISLTDIHASVAYIEIPLVFGYTLSLPYISFFPYVGGSLSFILADNTSFERKRLLYTNEEISELLRPDYSEKIESTFGNNHTDFIVNLGLELQLKHYIIEIRYIIDLRNAIWVDKIDKLKYKTQGLSILLGYRI